MFSFMNVIAQDTLSAPDYAGPAWHRQVVADLSLDKEILKEALSKK